jgi:CSLREA domain-containing protein
MSKNNKIALGVILAILVLGTSGVNRTMALAQVEIEVNTLADELNYPEGDGDCSLREALKAANDNIPVDACPAGSPIDTDKIFLQSGQYILALGNPSGIPEDLGETGDLDIRDSVEIIGDGVANTIVNGNTLDRVFHLVVTGIEVSISKLTVRNGELIGGVGGAGILVGNAMTLNLSHCLITDNDATNTLGGGIDNYAGTVTITDCTIEDNSAEEGGGIYNDGTLFIYRSLIHNNLATEQGGGLKNAEPGGYAELENVTISWNNCSVGSGIYTNRPLYLTNVTLARNLGTGNAIANNNIVTMKNSIIALTLGGSNCSTTGNFISAGNNLEDGDTCDFDPEGLNDIIDTDPLLLGDQPMDYGGPTFSWALDNGSPAIDAGTNPGCPSMDQRGKQRPRDGDGDDIWVCDIGAYEFAPLVIYYYPAVFR